MSSLAGTLSEASKVCNKVRVFVTHLGSFNIVNDRSKYTHESRLKS
jgi:hypothetical protein